MSNETTPAVERGSSALRKHPLFGCTCCTYPEGYEKDHPDACPVVDGDVEHDYSDECWKNASWSDILTADVLKAALVPDEMARDLCRALHSTRWQYAATASPCDECVKGADGLRTALLGTTS